VWVNQSTEQWWNDSSSTHRETSQWWNDSSSTHRETSLSRRYKWTETMLTRTVPKVTAAYFRGQTTDEPQYFSLLINDKFISISVFFA